MQNFHSANEIKFDTTYENVLKYPSLNFKFSEDKECLNYFVSSLPKISLLDIEIFNIH